jgi:hypothetical protein
VHASINQWDRVEVQGVEIKGLYGVEFYDKGEFARAINNPKDRTSSGYRKLITYCSKENRPIVIAEGDVTSAVYFYTHAQAVDFLLRAKSVLAIEVISDGDE